MRKVCDVVWPNLEPSPVYHKPVLIYIVVLLITMSLDQNIAEGTGTRFPGSGTMENGFLLYEKYLYLITHD